MFILAFSTVAEGHNLKLSGVFQTCKLELEKRIRIHFKQKFARITSRDFGKGERVQKMHLL